MSTDQPCTLKIGAVNLNQQHTKCKSSVIFVDFVIKIQPLFNAADGLKKLGEYAAKEGINVVVENHGGYSSDGLWLAGVMKTVNLENVGTLPDFGNFCIERGPDGCLKEYDRYKGIAELMPFAKGVSAKTHVFDSAGNESEMDYARILKIVKDAGFKGNIGIEYEGTEVSEDEGIKTTKALIEKVLK